jgi:hypothetical protein
MQFAAKVAQGKSLVGAYREVYQPSDGNRATTYRDAKRKAKHPGIAERIQELQIQMAPAPEDMKAVYAHGLAMIIQMATDCEDSKTRLAAAERLLTEAKEQIAEREKREREKRPQGGPAERVILAELRALYAKALPGIEPPLVEAVPEEEGEK